MQLEEAFFNGQPVSIRKTVDFVSERISSACVKNICNKIVPEFKKESVREFKKILKGFDKVESNLLQKQMDFTAICLKNLKNYCSDQVEIMIEERVETCIALLLSAEELPEVKRVCVWITKRMCLERVNQWINSHVNPGVFSKEFDSELKRFLWGSSEKEKSTFPLPPEGKSCTHNALTVTPFKAIECIRVRMIFLCLFYN